MFNEKTSAGYKIITIIPDGDQEHVIAKRSMSWGDDYVVGLGYHRDDGTWNQGMYSYDTIDDALEALIDAKFSFKKNSLIKIAKKGINVEIYIDRDYNVDININDKSVTYCDGETIRNNAEIDGVTPQEWIDAFVIDPLETVETLEQVLDEFDLPYVIGDTVYDLIDDYTASDAYSEEDVARLRAMEPERQQEVIRCRENITFF